MIHPAWSRPPLALCFTLSSPVPVAAPAADSNEVRSVRESFASSVLWAGPIEAEGADGRLLVDLTSFVVRDAHGVAATLKNAKQGSFTLDKDRSTLDPVECKAFPDN